MRLPELQAHPEGGRFQEVYRSATKVSCKGGGQRDALTHIYFSLNKGEHSRFHSVDNDEVWNLYLGEGIRLYLWDGEAGMVEVVELSHAASAYCHVVPAGWWQAAEPLGNSVTVGCTVAPGFEFSDFKIIDEDSRESRALAAIDPELERFIRDS
jgi:predicted cupin superfamily sugar epimerase